MSEKEKNIIKRIADTVTKLDAEKQNYILGVAEVWPWQRTPRKITSCRKRREERTSEMKERGEELRDYVKNLYSELREKAKTYGDMEKLIHSTVRGEFSVAAKDAPLNSWVLNRLMDMLHEEWSRVSTEKAAKKRILYLCDGKCECGGQGECYKIGGQCRRTHDINHAKNFHQFMSKGPFQEDEPEAGTEQRERTEETIRGGCFQGTCQEKGNRGQARLRGTDAGISLRSILEQLKKVDQNAAGKTEITIIGKRKRPIPWDPEDSDIKDLMADVCKFREEYPDAKINVEFTE